MSGSKGPFPNVANQFGKDNHGISLHSRLPGIEDGTAQKFVTNRWATEQKFTPGFAQPVLFLVIVLAVAGLLGVRLYVAKQAYFKAWFSSALNIIGCTFFGVIGLFPSLFPSSIDPALNLTAFNASSSPLTLKIMLIVVILFVPLVLAYQVWAYNLFKTKVSKEDMVY